MNRSIPGALPRATLLAVTSTALLAACASPAVPDARPVGEIDRDAAAGTAGSNPAETTVRSAYLAEASGREENDSETARYPPVELVQGMGGRGGAHQNFNVLLGIRHMEDSVWGPLDDQPVIGFEWDRRSRNSALGFELGFASAYDWESVGIADLETYTFEIYAGPRLTFGDRNGTFYPYVGGGLSWFYTDLETFFGVRQRDSDNSFAGYAHTGIYFKAGGGTNLGVDFRGLFGSELNLGGISADGDYYQVALILGGGF